MAHKSDKGHKKHKDKHEAQGGVARKSSKPKGPNPHKHSKPSIRHQSKKPEGVKKVSKPKISVNIAGIFKKSKHAEKKQQKHKHRALRPEATLADQFKNGIEQARTTIDSKLKASFDAAHNELLQKLSKSRKRDVLFFESISASADMLSVPLVNELVETTFTRPDGRKDIETLNIGASIAKFKKDLAKDEAKLKGYWKQWEAVQDELIELGMEVFGPEVFSDKTPEGKEGKGYKNEMELLNIEHDAKVQELYEEIDAAKVTYLEKMRTSEMELDQVAKAQQIKLLHALVQDEDILQRS